MNDMVLIKHSMSCSCRLHERRAVRTGAMAAHTMPAITAVLQRRLSSSHRTARGTLITAGV